jgi:peptidoglycan/LPS O-acetylase OafA/YrhL
MPATPFFPGIHALRAAAATLVVLEHAFFVAGDYSLFGVSMVIPYVFYGRVGVILFFAISGFVIALQRTRPVHVFITHRLLRIYPGYWLALTTAAIAFTAVGLPASAGLSTILLYPSAKSEGGMWIPYWTLAFEMTFYALAALAFAFRLSDRMLTVLALAWIVVVNLFASNPHNPDEYAFPGAWILVSSAVQVFPMGLICGIHFERLRRLGRWPYLLGSALAFAGSIPFAELTVARLLMHGISASCLILAAADLNIRNRIVMRLGDASYGIYLLHFPAMMCCAALSPSHGFVWFLLIGMASGTAFGLLDHTLYRWLTAHRIARPRSALSDA